MYIYDKIKKICEEKGMSITYVEKKAELGNGLISKWNDSVPSVANLKKVANILEVTVDELIGEWGQAVKKRYSHKKMRAWSEYPLITRISFVLSCTALVLAIARLLLK